MTHGKIINKPAKIGIMVLQQIRGLWKLILGSSISDLLVPLIFSHSCFYIYFIYVSEGIKVGGLGMISRVILFPR